jgi:predicted transcriptional regulator
MAQQQLFKVRDLRKRDQFKIDDKYLNGYARVCGIYATAVYNSLSRHAQFASQEAFPSIELIAEQHNISRPSVIKGIKHLQKYGIIEIIKEKDFKGRQKKNVYILIDKSDWKEVRVNDVDSESRVNEISKPSQPHFKNRVNEVDCKDNTVEGYTYKDTYTATPSVAAKEIQEIIDLFKNVNPSYQRFFANKTQRAAVSRLIKQHSAEKIRRIIEVLPRTNSERYMPVITTPLQLEEKLGALVVALGKKSQSNVVKVR